MKAAIPEQVADVLETYSPEQQARVRAYRDEILAVVETTPEIGDVEECLKWGVPSYLPEKSNIGSTIRLSPLKESGEIALFFICTSGLVDEFREIYPDAFHYHGNRAVTVKDDIEGVRAELRHIIGLALTMKLRRKKSRLNTVVRHLDVDCAFF